MRKTMMLLAAGLLSAASAQAVITTENNTTFDLLQFHDASPSLLSPQAVCSAGCNEMLFNGGLGGALSVTGLQGSSSAGVNQTVAWNGGLGLGADTWVGAGEILKLSFATAVNMVGYHAFTGSGADYTQTFLVSNNLGSTWEQRVMGTQLFDQWHAQNWLTNSGSLWFKTDTADFRLGALKITSAVPEPSTYALLLAGLGVVGFMARRRRAE
jgi:hypothetical protein